VPELLVINQGERAVLLVDGEELVGAKQNRVLNTSVLVRGKSETKKRRKTSRSRVSTSIENGFMNQLIPILAGLLVLLICQLFKRCSRR